MKNIKYFLLVTLLFYMGCAFHHDQFDPYVIQGFATKTGANWYAARARHAGYTTRLSHTDNWFECGGPWFVVLDEKGKGDGISNSVDNCKIKE